MIASNKHDRPEMRREESLNDKIVQIDECKNSTNDKIYITNECKNSTNDKISLLAIFYFILF
jgi:hypothetical protein